MFYYLLAGLYSEHVRDYDVVIPHKITFTGEFITSLVTHHHQRRKRDTISQEAVHYRITIAGEEEILDLTPSDDFISSTLRVERKSRSSPVSGYAVMCHYRGTVRGQADSSVALSACNGLVSNNYTRSVRLFLVWRRSLYVSGIMYKISVLQYVRRVTWTLRCNLSCEL